MMASYSTQYTISADQYGHCDDPQAMIASVEGRVRETLTGASDDVADDVETGWLARIPGVDEAVAGPGQGRAPQWVPWTPGDLVPDGTDELVCRGRRTG